MEEFDPDRPCRVHDALNGRTFFWRPSWAADWRQYARSGGDGTAWFDGLVLDSWTPLGSDS